MANAQLRQLRVLQVDVYCRSFFRWSCLIIGKRQGKFIGNCMVISRLWPVFLEISSTIKVNNPNAHRCHNTSESVLHPAIKYLRLGSSWLLNSLSTRKTLIFWSNLKNLTAATLNDHQLIRISFTNKTSQFTVGESGLSDQLSVADFPVLNDC